MSFLPPFLSGDLSETTESETTESFESSKQPKILVLKQVTHQLLRALQPTGLYQHIEYLWTHKSGAQVSIRSHFDTRLERDWQRLEQERQPLSVFLCEVDDFALIRRQHGDLACNTYIRQVVKVIHTNIEHSKGMLARYQGDTFAVLLPNASIDEAACIAKKIRLRVRALKKNHRSPSSIPGQSITLSLGIATIVPTSKLTPANLIAAAEQSLRQAQRAGGNRVILQGGSR